MQAPMPLGSDEDGPATLAGAATAPAASVPRDRRAALALVACVLGFYLPAITLRGVYFYGDVAHYFPRLAFTAAALRAGQLPLWNPMLSLGAPHAADVVTMPWYPAHVLLFLALGETAAYNGAVVLHVLLAAI